MKKGNKNKKVIDIWHNAVIYVRSTEKGSFSGNGLEAQLAMCLAYCENHRFKVVGVYRDDSVPTGDIRSQKLDSALAHCSDKKECVTVLMVPDGKIISQQEKQHITIANELVDCGVAIIELSDCACGEQLKKKYS